MKPNEKEQATIKWNKAWNTQEPIESMYFNLEELFVQSVIAGVPHTPAQLLNKGLDKVKTTGLFITAVVQWNGLDPNVKSWIESRATSPRRTRRI